ERNRRRRRNHHRHLFDRRRCRSLFVSARADRRKRGSADCRRSDPRAGAEHDGHESRPRVSDLTVALRGARDYRGVTSWLSDRFCDVDVVVNNAPSTARAALEDAPVELWDTIMQVNLRAPFLLLQEATKSMKARGGGSIVNIGSINAYIGEPKLGPYSVSKGG